MAKMLRPPGDHILLPRPHSGSRELWSSLPEAWGLFPWSVLHGPACVLV